jgi:hypothetical protein
MKDGYEFSRVADVLYLLGYRNQEEWEKVVSQLLAKISMAGFKEVEFLPKASSFIMETGNVYFCLVTKIDKVKDEFRDEKYKFHFIFLIGKKGGSLPNSLSEDEAERLEVNLNLPQYNYQEVIGHL